MPAAAEVPLSQVQSVTVGPQRLRVAIRPGRPNEAGHPHRPPLLLINGIGARLEALEPFAAVVDPAVEVIRFDRGGAVAQHFAAFQRARCRRLVLTATAAGAPMVLARPSVITEAATLAPVVDGFLAAP